MPRPGRRRRAALALVATGLLAPGLASCAAAAPESSGGDTVTVFAAASLTGVFTDLADDFERAHPGIDVQLGFAGSADLATQIRAGAPADVFASADERTMTALGDEGLLDGDPVDIATNVLEIAVPPGNPAGVRSLADLAGEGVATVLCAPQVPCGAAAATVQEIAGVSIRPVSEESSVTDVLGKVRSGEADAGLVYVTDVLAAGSAVEGIPFPESARAITRYPIAMLDGGATPDLARDFVAFASGEEGRAVLTAAGFGAP